MAILDLNFEKIDFHFPMILVEGQTYPFGFPNNSKEINIGNFYISKFPVTQILWEHIMGRNPAFFKGKDRPVEFVSFHDIVSHSGFLEKLNNYPALKDRLPAGSGFRLPSETEWEFAARGGKNWSDGFLYSGSNDLNEVGWYELNSGKYTDPAIIHQLKNHQKATETHPVGGKNPNQLGLHDLCGNVWEWCQDYFQADTSLIPNNGRPCDLESEGRVLRGGCHHNWAIHCTVSKRYEISPDAADECIGFRIAFTP